MSISEFISTSGLPANIGLESLELSPQQVSQIERLIEERSKAVTDYQYTSKDQAITRTAITDVVSSDRWATSLGLVGYGAFFIYAGRRYHLFDNIVKRSFLRLGCLFFGTAVYLGVSQGAYRNLKGTSSRINQNISNEISQMMDLDE